MAYLLFTQEFAASASIHVQHNQDAEVGVRVVIDGQSRQDLIRTVELDSGDPYNGLTVNLKSAQTGRVQILDSQIFQDGSYLFWQRDVASGILFPTDITDDIAVGGYVSPTGKWFQDGALVLGGNAMAGTEKIRVNGSHLIDQDSNALGLDIDSEATGAPLINLQGLNGNSRGDIAFGTSRTGNPSAPSQGDLWYESTNKYFRYHDGSAVRTLATLTNLPVYGTQAQQANNDAQSTTTSGTYQQKLRVTTPSLPAGTYRIGFYYEWGKSNLADFASRVQVNDTTTIMEGLEEAVDAGADQYFPRGGFGYYTGSGVLNIDLDYHANGSGTARIRRARLEIWRVS
jgi:hypothetical protein